MSVIGVRYNVGLPAHALLPPLQGEYIFLLEYVYISMKNTVQNGC